MRDETVARGYADTLFDLARRHEGLEAYEEAVDLVVRLLEEDPRFRLFLETPRVADAARKDVLQRVFGSHVPPYFLRFLSLTIDWRRQRLVSDVAREFHRLVDEHLGREHVEVTLARRPDEEILAAVARKLSDMLGREAIPHVRVDPAILGGIVVRAGDTIYDGSLRRRLNGLRRHLFRTELSPGGAPARGMERG